MRDPSTLYLEMRRLKLLPGLKFLEEPDRRSIVGKAALEILLGVIGGSFVEFAVLLLLLLLMFSLQTLLISGALLAFREL
jgi:hypothetical protein